MSSLFFGLCAVCIGILLNLSASPACAQSISAGTVSGQVTDQQKAVVPGADVTLLDVETKASRTTITNETGRYTFVNIPPGTYDISVSLAGFSTAKVSGQKVTVGEELTINVMLSVGALTETVEVTAAAGAQLQTANATVGSTIAGETLVMLPNFARDASALATLQPLVTPGGNVAGTASDQSTFQLDGGNNSDNVSGTQSYAPIISGVATGVVPTPVESIEEFKVATANQTADFNSSAGSQIQMVTKRGTNQWHGALYEYYFGSNVGAANTWKNNHTQSKSEGLPYTPLPKSHYNRFGAAAGGPLLPSFWGGKTYIFGNYEGYRFPETTTFERSVPTALMRAGVIQLPNSAGVYIPYNLNPSPVTVNGVTYQPSKCGPNSTPCDPRGIGLNPIVNQIWSKYMPLPNDPQWGSGDQYNTQGYLSTISLPKGSDFFVARIDKDFSPKWHFMASYRYYTFRQLTSGQVDIGGALPGSTFGQARSLYSRPSKPTYYVAGLTTTITPRLTNDFRFSYLRNWWQYATAAAPPQLPGLGGAVEIGGDTSNALIPYNVNGGSMRQRDWNSQNKAVRDDISYLHGNHLFQFGGNYQRNFEQHHRDDNGVGTITSIVYQVTGGAGIAMPPAYLPSGLPSNQVSNWNNLYAQVLGLVSQPQVIYSRSGPNLELQPLGTWLFAQTIIPTYNVYFTDTWRMRPSFTLTYGLGYAISMPGYELQGKQATLVDNAAYQIDARSYLAQRQKAALAGQVFNPILGYATVRNAEGGLKYPFQPFYGGFSPRLAAAWNPSFGDGILGKVLGHNNTVIRGGYSRTYGRLDGGPMVMAPLLGTGLGQAVACIGASRAGECLGNSGVDPTTAFRIGTDGMAAPLPAVSKTLPQPYLMGVGGNAAAGDGSSLDSIYKPLRSDQFTLTIQRALSRKLMIEAGYMGRIIRDENQGMSLDAVPYMMTLNGQRFDNAFANLYTALSSGQAVQTQPFFEAAMGGANSSYCAKFASCTAAVAANLKSAILSTQVYNIWSTLSNQSSWTLGRTMLSSAPAQVSSQILYSSMGYGNYNAAFLSFTARDWYGLGARSNFTWGRAFGTGAGGQTGSGRTAADPYDLRVAYGRQDFDIKFMYNLTMLYQPPYFKNQKGFLGPLLGGWSFAPIFTARSGLPLRVSMSTGTRQNCQSFGESNCGTVSAYENAVLIAPYTGGNSANYNVSVASGPGINGNADRGGSGINMFADPNATYKQFRRLILGIDRNAGGSGRISGLPTWNLDMTIAKDFRATERFGATLMFQLTNILNHFQASNPTLNVDSPQTWGVINDQANNPRQMEFGLRIRF